MAVIQSIPGVQVDIRPGDNDEESFKEYNPGEEEAAPWPKNLDPALAPEKDEDEVQCLDVPTHPPGSTPEAAVTSVEANDRPANSAKSRQPNAGTRKSKRNTSLKKTPKSRQQRPMQPKLTTEVCTRYIQASNGQSFRLCFTFLSSFIHKRYDVLADIYIDGKIVDNMLFERQDLQSDSGPGGWKSFAAGSRRIREKPGGLGGTEWQVLPWKFSDLDIDTDHYGKVSDRLKASLRNVGKITVKLWRVVIVKAGKGNHKRFNNLKARQMVPERALKGQAVSLEAGTCPAQAIGDVQVSDTETLDSKPFAEFVFCYRTLQDLEALHLIPRRKPLFKRKWEELTSDEKEALAMQYHKKMQETMRIKREYSEALKDDREDKVECLGTSNAKRAKGAEAADMVHDE